MTIETLERDELEQIGTATVDIRYHGLVLLIDMEFMDTRTISPNNITRYVNNGEIFEYACKQVSDEDWDHFIFIENKWLLLTFDAKENS